jgi:hypothetical protein
MNGSFWVSKMKEVVSKGRNLLFTARWLVPSYLPPWQLMQRPGTAGRAPSKTRRTSKSPLNQKMVEWGTRRVSASCFDVPARADPSAKRGLVMTRRGLLVEIGVLRSAQDDNRETDPYGTAEAAPLRKYDERQNLHPTKRWLDGAPGSATYGTSTAHATTFH